MSRIPIICFAAPSGTGKTTLIERVTGCLVARGIRVGAIKHDAHKVELDRPGKDSWRLRQAGAVRTILAANNQLAVFDTAEQQRSVRELVEQFLSDVDIVIAEGFRTSGEPTIIVERTDGPDRKDWEPPITPIAIVSDAATDGTLPVLGLNAPDEVATFICQQFGIEKSVGAIRELPRQSIFSPSSRLQSVPDGGDADAEADSAHPGGRIRPDTK